MAKDLKTLKSSMIEVSKLMHSKGFVCATDGNISIKVGKDRYLITPSGINKAFLKPADLIVIDEKAKVISGNKKYKPSTEWRMHLKAYKMRPDINAVIHAHPPYVTAYTIADVKLPADILPETILTMGNIPITSYSTPTSPDNADIIEEHIKSYDAVVLKRHGVITVGKDIYSAYNKLEKLEHTAITAVVAKMIGEPLPLPKEEVEKLLAMGAQMGFLSDKCVAVCKKSLLD